MKTLNINTLLLALVVASISMPSLIFSAEVGKQVPVIDVPLACQLYDAMKEQCVTSYCKQNSLDEYKLIYGLCRIIIPAHYNRCEEAKKMLK